MNDLQFFSIVSADGGTTIERHPRNIDPGYQAPDQ